jgi:hypothetical protein
MLFRFGDFFGSQPESAPHLAISVCLGARDPSLAFASRGSVSAQVGATRRGEVSLEVITLPKED